MGRHAAEQRAHALRLTTLLTSTLVALLGRWRRCRRIHIKRYPVDDELIA